MLDSKINAGSAEATRRGARAVGFFGVAEAQNDRSGVRAALAERPSLEQFEDRFSHTVVGHPKVRAA